MEDQCYSRDNTSQIREEHTMIKDLIKYSELYSLNFPYKNMGVHEFFPKPTVDNYKDSFIPRFFLKKINDYKIIEVDFKDFGNANPDLYYRIMFNWSISGPKNSIYVKGKLQSVGAEELNKKSIKNAEKSMVGIKNKLINPLQFYKP